MRGENLRKGIRTDSQTDPRGESTGKKFKGIKESENAPWRRFLREVSREQWNREIDAASKRGAWP